MIPRVKDVIELIEEVAPSTLAESWDNPGLQVGSLTPEVHKIIFSLDPTFAALSFACTRNAQLLICHHPLIFSPLKHVNPEIYPGNVISEALKSGISIIAVHTNLDASRHGINTILAESLKLEDVAVLEPMLDQKDFGIGRIGMLPSEKPFRELVEQCKKIFGISTVRVVYAGREVVRRIAVVGGSGGSFIQTAWKRGAEVLVTGDVNHHQMREAEDLGLALIDAGHYATEKLAIDIFAKKMRQEVQERGWDISLETFDQETGPGQYI